MPGSRPRHVLVLGALTGVVALTVLPSAGAGDRRAAGCANAATPSTRITQAQARSAVTCLINRKRAGRRKLRLRDSLSAPARKHSATMLEQGCFSHQCPGEPSRLSRRLRRYAAGARRVRLGEVIALSVARAAPRDIVGQWLASAQHRELILGRFKHVGVGFAIGGGGSYYTADLGAKG